MKLVKSQISNPKFQINPKLQNSNSKRFDKPFDHLDKLGIFNRLTVLSKVEGLTTLSPVEGQISKYNDSNSKPVSPLE
jgi:hypothetical protein